MPQSTTTKPPSLPKIVLGFLEPLLMVGLILYKGLLPTLRHMLFHPLSIPFPSEWLKSLFKVSQPYILAQVDKIYANSKRELLSQAKGRVLEVGAGTGESIKYYDKSKIDVIYGVEPNVNALGGLRKALIKNDIMEKYEILPFGVEDEKRMTEMGVFPESIDTIVCVLCLCSIPTPENIISAMYPLLKSGGTILVFEHVASDYPFAHFAQTLYTNLWWRFVMDGCELNRPTGQYLLTSGNVKGRRGWKEVELQSLPGEGWWSVFPHIVGKLVKA